MSDAVLMTAIICATLIVLALVGRKTKRASVDEKGRVIYGQDKEGRVNS